MTWQRVLLIFFDALLIASLSTFVLYVLYVFYGWWKEKRQIVK